VTHTFARKRHKPQSGTEPLLNDELHRGAVSHTAITAPIRKLEVPVDVDALVLLLKVVDPWLVTELG
jgi:hypothetical protein